MTEVGDAREPVEELEEPVDEDDDDVEDVEDEDDEEDLEDDDEDDDDLDDDEDDVEDDDDDLDDEEEEDEDDEDDAVGNRLEEGEGPDLDDDSDDDMAGNRIVGASARAVLEYVARSIVEDAEAVVVHAEEDRRGLVLRLSVAPDDVGRIIGRRGRVAQSLRAVVRAAAAREGVEVTVDIVD
jgi:predicted RNA-binding protein YlqC (UPF0109 family)